MDLIDCMSGRYATAKSYWRVIFLTQGVVLGISLAQAFDPSQRLLLIAGTLSMAGPVCVYFLKNAAATYYGQGEHLRRLLVLSEGLGQTVSESETKLILLDAPEIVMNLEPRSRGKYFDTNLPVGPKRVARIIQESAFYTQKLAEVAGNIYFLLVALGMAVAVWVLWAALSLGHPTGPDQIAKAFSSVIVFFAAGMFVGLYSSFSSLSIAARRTYEKASQLVAVESVELSDALLLMADYDCSLAKAPPIPGFAHWLMRDRISNAWSAAETQERSDGAVRGKIR